MNFTKLLNTVCFLMISSLIYAQEICDNSIDDDGDGFIDLMDSDCDCSGSEETLLEDFENFITCPFNFTPCDADPNEGFNCLDSEWEYGSEPTDNNNCNSPDFFHMCDYFGNAFIAPPVPAPSGDGLIGLVSISDGNGWSESIGRCLGCSIIEGETYDVSFFAGFNETNGTFESNSPAEFAIYGKEDCNNFPAPTGVCPEVYGYKELGTFQAIGENGTWTLVNGTFTADANYEAIIFTKSCSFITSSIHSENEFHYIDLLNITGNFSGVNCISSQIEITGDCLSGYSLQASPENAIQYQWYRDGIAIIGATDNAWTIESPILGEYQVRAIYANGECAVSTPIELTETDLEVIDLTSINTDPLCFGEINGSIEMIPNSPNNPLSFSWSTGSEDPILTNIGAGDYSVTVTDSNSCFGTFTTTLIEADQISIDLLTTSPLCINEMNGSIEVITDNPNEFYDFYWNTGSQDTLLTNVASGNYSLTVTDINGCSNTAGTNIPQANPFLLNTSITQPTFSNGGIIEIFANGGISPYQYEWNTGNSGPLQTDLAAGNYSVTVTDFNNCTLVENFEFLDPLMGEDIRNKIYIPNTFSPNNDGLNDIFEFFCSPTELITSVNAIRIFDRWGSLIFETENQKIEMIEFWDGTLNGELTSQGIYAYIIDLKLYSGEDLRLFGDITVIR